MIGVLIFVAVLFVSGMVTGAALLALGFKLGRDHAERARLREHPEHPLMRAWADPSAAERFLKQPAVHFAAEDDDSIVEGDETVELYPKA